MQNAAQLNQINAECCSAPDTPFPVHSPRFSLDGTHVQAVP